MARDIQRQVSDLQENPIAKGRELELSLLGPGPGLKYDPENDRGGIKEKNIQDLELAQSLVVRDIDDLEQRGEDASEEDPDFKYAEITTKPESPYVFSLYDELAKILECDDPSDKKIQYYNTLGTMLDLRFGTDFMLKINPVALSEKKFGKGIKKLRDPLFISVDITGNASKSASKADIVLQYDKLPDTQEERKKWGKEAAFRIMNILIAKLRSGFYIEKNAPIFAELNAIREAEKQKETQPASTVTTIRSGVVKRVKTVERNV